MKRIIDIVMIILMLFLVFLIFMLIQSIIWQFKTEDMGKDLCERIQLMDYKSLERLDNGYIEITCEYCSETKIAETNDLKYSFKSCNEHKFIIKEIKNAKVIFEGLIDPIYKGDIKNGKL